MDGFWKFMKTYDNIYGYKYNSHSMIYIIEFGIDWLLTIIIINKSCKGRRKLISIISYRNY